MESVTFWPTQCPITMSSLLSVELLLQRDPTTATLAQFPSALIHNAVPSLPSLFLFDKFSYRPRFPSSANIKIQHQRQQYLFALFYHENDASWLKLSQYLRSWSNDGELFEVVYSNDNPDFIYTLRVSRSSSCRHVNYFHRWFRISPQNIWLKLRVNQSCHFWNTSRFNLCPIDYLQIFLPSVQY